MNVVTGTKTYAEPPFCEREILRYAGCRAADHEIKVLLDQCMQEAKSRLIYKVCYRELPVSIKEDLCDFGLFVLQSKHLAENLKGCRRVVLFAATIGVEIDRLIAKYGRISPAKALMFQAIGAERIEAVCDVFCRDVAKETNCALRPRFSPGYGDLPLEAQKDLFAVLDCGKSIGVFLNDSLLMSPSKSVTAFLGLCGDEKEAAAHQCSACDKTDCIFRGAI